MNAKQRQLRHADYLEHMINAISLARSHVEGLNKDDFLADKKTQQAVILNIIVIGEAATRIADEYPEFTAAHPEVPWKTDARHAQPHGYGYFEINLDVVWDTVQLSLPELERQILRIQPK